MLVRNLVVFLIFVSIVGQIKAQNPLISGQFTADPSARVFGNRIYVYPSHDIIATEGKGRPGWFSMEDYHVFSSANLTDWTDHGVIVAQQHVAWVKPNSYSMWAPDCIARNGKYYFYFPSTPKDTVTYGKGFTIGVAIADRPEGPFVAQSAPIKGVRGIDPNVFIDKDGQAYLYWSGGNIYAAKLKPNMLELDSEVTTLGNLPNKGLKEGPYMFERNGIYYLTYPHVENKIERLEYATGTHPLGPFTVKGVIMDESETGCWTNHHSIVEFKQQLYLFYHHNDYSPKFDKARSIRADSLTFNADGTIRKVLPTFRGIGVSQANKPIQIDRYSKLSGTGVKIAFLDSAETFKGWKTIFNQKDSWLQYNSVDFGNPRWKNAQLMARSTTGGSVELRSGSPTGKLVANITIPKAKDFSPIKSILTFVPAGIHHLFVVMKGEGEVEVDWINFQ